MGARDPGSSGGATPVGPMHAAAAARTLATLLVSTLGIVWRVQRQNVLLAQSSDAALWAAALGVLCVAWTRNHSPILFGTLVFFLLLPVGGQSWIIVQRYRGYHRMCRARHRHLTSPGAMPGTPRHAGTALRPLACCGFAVIYLLYASFALVAKPALARMDPVVFVCLQMLLLVPCGIALLLPTPTRSLLNRAVLLRGLLFGACLATGFLCLAVALKDETITQSTIISCVDGLVATLLAWRVFHQRIAAFTIAACAFSALGSLFVWLATPAMWQADCTALLGGTVFTVFAFLVERLLLSPTDRRLLVPFRPVLGVQLLTMAGVAGVFALCCGNWQSLRTGSWTDVGTLCYTSIATVLVPVVAAPLLQRYVSPVTVAFLAVLEPLTCTAVAFGFGERLPWPAYVGTGIVLVGVVLQAAVSAVASGAGQTHTGVIAAGHRQAAGLYPLIRLGPHSFMLLSYLAQMPGGGTRELAHSTGLSYTQVSHLLRALHRNGYVNHLRSARHRYTLSPGCFQIVHRHASAWTQQYTGSDHLESREDTTHSVMTSWEPWQSAFPLVCMKGS